MPSSSAAFPTTSWHWLRLGALAVVAIAIYLWLSREADHCDVYFHTEQSRVTAELLSESGDLVMPPFTLPNLQPVRLPKGAYRVRLTSPDYFGHTTHILVDEDRAFEIHLPNQLVGGVSIPPNHGFSHRNQEYQQPATARFLFV